MLAYLLPQSLLNGIVRVFLFQLDYCASLKNLETVSEKKNYKFIQVIKHSLLGNWTFTLIQRHKNQLTWSPELPKPEATAFIYDKVEITSMD